MKDICIVCGSHNPEAVVMNGLPAYHCSSCGLRWLKEEPREDYYQTVYPIELAEGKVSDRVLNVRDRIRLFGRYAALDNLCDIGCGEGLFLSELKRQGATHVCGVEPNPENVRYAQAHGLHVLQGGIADVEELFSGERIDVFTMFHVIEHLSNPRAALEELRKGMKKGSVLIVETPNSDSFSMRKKKYAHSLVHEEHLFYFNRNNLAQLLRSAGFEVMHSGIRGYASANPGIRESLFRLGLIRAGQEVRHSEEPGHTVGDSTPAAFPQHQPAVWRRVVGRALWVLVRAIGRVDYMWFIVRT